MFCPNCGAQNPDASATCNKCGFNLKGGASPKFKGTMLMMNAADPSAQPPGAPGAPPGPPAPAGAPGAPAGTDPKPKLKGTMIGVAPPSGGFGPPPGQGAPFGAPGPAAPPGVSQGEAGGHGPSAGGVNPMAGTMVANAPPAGWGPPPGAPDAGAAPATLPQGGPGTPGGGPPYGGAPMGAPGGAPYGAPGGAPPMGAPYGGPGGSAPMGAPGGAAPMGIGGAMTPYAPPAGAAMATGNKLFQEKSPVAVFFLTLVTCGIYSIFWYAGHKDAMEARGAEIGPTWHIFIPILGLIWVWKWCQGVEKVTNGQITATSTLLKLWFLGAIGMAWLQSDFNDQ